MSERYWECRSEGWFFSQEEGQTFEWFVAGGTAMVRCPSCGLALYRTYTSPAESREAPTDDTR